MIAAQGTPTGAPACSQCHAFNGVSDASGAFPRIAGQSAYYLAKQLRDFASGIRVNALMTPIARSFAFARQHRRCRRLLRSQNAPFLPLRPPDPALVKRGEQLAKVGSAKQRIQACNNCHGPKGAGEPPAIPYLAGQYAHYIDLISTCGAQVSARAVRSSMEAVAKNLDDQDIAAVAAYYQQVNPLSKRLCHRARSDMTGETHDTAAARLEHVTAPIARGGGCAFMRGKSGLMP